MDVQRRLSGRESPADKLPYHPGEDRLWRDSELAGLVAYMLSPGSGVMTGALVDYDQNVAGAYPE